MQAKLENDILIEYLLRSCKLLSAWFSIMIQAEPKSTTLCLLYCFPPRLGLATKI